MRYAIVTGTSRGLGAAIAKSLFVAGIHVIGIARNDHATLATDAQEHGVSYTFYQCDLANVHALKTVCTQIEKTLNPLAIEVLYIVNNAAVLEPIRPASQIELNELNQHIQVNVTAPIHMMNTFLNYGLRKDIKVIGVMITSGAADQPIYGWSLYGSMKASLDAYTKTVALEQKILKTKHQIIAFNPGIMDTDMQAMIRSSTKDQFIDVERFRAYKENSQLRHPDDVAQVLVDVMLNDREIKNGHIYAVKDFVT